MERNSYFRQMADQSGTDVPKPAGAGSGAGLLMALLVALGCAGFWLISDKVINNPDLPSRFSIAAPADKAIAQREQVRARNDAKKRQYKREIEAFKKAKTAYEEELKTFKKAKSEYASLHRLDFANRSETEILRTNSYQDIVREFPGTAAAREAQRRLAGGAPKALPVPPEPVAPTGPPRAPRQPEYEPEPP
jgi:hypothetical protein